VSFGAILLLAIGLSLDASAASASRGMSVARLRVRHVLMVAGLFGGFQALMPLLGWTIGSWLGPWLKAWDHWVAFVLLAAIGAKMIVEARAAARAHAAGTRPTQLPTSEPGSDPFGLKVMIGLALATSIDALAAGTSLPLLDAPFVLSLVTIGVTTALLSVAGLFAGRRLGALLGARLDLAGGVVLIGLGLKILVEHLSAT
jgi:manganese efflux pump family protein